MEMRRIDPWADPAAGIPAADRARKQERHGIPHSISEASDYPLLHNAGPISSDEVASLVHRADDLL